jgi:hypothetical protein
MPPIVFLHRCHSDLCSLNILRSFGCESRSQTLFVHIASLRTHLDAFSF